MSEPDFETYHLGDWPLQSGSTLPKAYIAFKTFGDVKNPAIVYPTWFSGCQNRAALESRSYNDISQPLQTTYG